MHPATTTPTQDHKPTSLRAGVAKCLITTEDPNARIHDPLYAKVLVLDNGIKRLVLIAMDALAIGGIGDLSDDFFPRLQHHLASKLAIPAESLLINASHTHPPGRLLCEEATIHTRLIAAVTSALATCVPVVIGAGSGNDDTIMINRTFRLKDGSHWTYRHACPCPPDQDIVGLGPVDSQLGVIRIDRVDGTPLAVVFNFAGHPLLGVPDGSITANYPGFAGKVIEEHLGAMALFLQGAGGDICERQYKDFHRPRDARPVGERLGLKVLEVWRTIATGPTDIASSRVTIEIPRRGGFSEHLSLLQHEQDRLVKKLRYCSLDLKSFLPLYLRNALHASHPADCAGVYMHDARIENDNLQRLDDANRRHIGRYLENISIMETLTKITDDIGTTEFHQNLNEQASMKPIASEVVAFRIGECVLISSAAEMLAEVGLNLKRNSPFGLTFVAAYSNGYTYYGAPASYYQKGGYEVTECSMAAEWQNIYEKAAVDLMRSLHQSQ